MGKAQVARSLAALATALTVGALAGCSLSAGPQTAVRAACEDEVRGAVSTWWRDQHGARPGSVDEIESDRDIAQSSDSDDASNTYYLSGRAEVRHGDDLSEVLWTCDARRSGDDAHGLTATIRLIRE